MKELKIDEKISVEQVEENLSSTICPIGVTEVTASLFVCGAHACPGGLKVIKPQYVVNAAPELPDTPQYTHIEYYKRIPILDNTSTDIYQYFDCVADMIQQVRKEGGRTLIHCVAGVSRSVTLCLAYLMKWENMTLKQAYNHIKKRRPQIRPNTGFFKQLIKYEQHLFNETTVQMVYCDVIDKHIPDLYVSDYEGMTWYKNRYGPIIRG